MTLLIYYSRGNSYCRTLVLFNQFAFYSCLWDKAVEHNKSLLCNICCLLLLRESNSKIQESLSKSYCCHDHHDVSGGLKYAFHYYGWSHFVLWLFFPFYLWSPQYCIFHHLSYFSRHLFVNIHLFHIQSHTLLHGYCFWMNKDLYFHFRLDTTK